jgi:septal ring factor EnvC (AmiA/AmiB activator)
MNADGIIQELGEKIKQLTISEAILKGQLVESQQEINRLNNMIDEKDMEIAELQTSKCQCGDEGCSCHSEEDGGVK